jgi:hypothetical protein
MLASDETFNGVDIFVLSYLTSLWATLSPDEIAEYIQLQLETPGVTQHRRIIFLAHSLSGLATRGYLLKNGNMAARAFLMYFFSTPTKGIQLASIARFLFSNPQFGEMKPNRCHQFSCFVAGALPLRLRSPGGSTNENRSPWSPQHCGLEFKRVSATRVHTFGNNTDAIPVSASMSHTS